MSIFALYFGGFVVAVAVIVLVSHLVWKHQIDSLPTPPHWLAAFELIWSDCYRMAWATRPRVIWVRGQSFVNCTGMVVAGETDGIAVTVAVENDATPVSSTALAHELWHVVLRYKGLDRDKEHISAAWGPGGSVQRANEALRAKGW